MSIDFRYKIEAYEILTKEFLYRQLSEEYEILKCEVNKDDIVSYFSVNPKNKDLVIFKENGYEFSFDDEKNVYWYTFLTREDPDKTTEFKVVSDVAETLYFDLDTDNM